MSVTPIGDLDALRRQIAATHARFAALGSRLARAAEAISTSGALPPDSLVREVQDAAHEFHAVRVAVLDVAAALEVLPPTPPRDVTSLRDLAPLMDTVVRAAEQAARRRRLDASRASAFSVLNFVPAIAHRDQSVFAPLAACQQKARALRDAIASADPDDVDAEVRSWGRAVAPFGALLELLEGPDADTDTVWSELEEIVAAAFGRRLASAATRGKLHIRCPRTGRLRRLATGVIIGPVPIAMLDVVVARATRPAPLAACRFRFPDPRRADADGLVASGGDFEPSTLIAAYRRGIFPWPAEGLDRLWWSPDPRAVIPLEGLHVSRRLAQTLRQRRFRVTIDGDFAAVMAGCADRGDDETWITPALRSAYARLHALGWAHSVEVWTLDGRMAGGLYGVSIGGLFAAESMFHRVTDASKVALVALVQQCRASGVDLLDVQMLSPHLASLGAVTVARKEYLRRLAEVVDRTVNFTAARSVPPVE